MKIELCVASPESIHLAKKYTFDRIELCQSLEIGGITPSLGMQQMTLDLFANTHVLIRCRAGNFVYTSEEKEIMLKDIEVSAKLGVAGVVVGALQEDFSIDLSFIQSIKEKFPHLELTFHRAFDELKNPLEALEQLIDLGVKRILTSGGKHSVSEGLQQLKKCIEVANKRIEIMIGGGINEKNVKAILEEIKPDALHFSGTVLKKKQDTSLFSEDLLEVNEAKIKAILDLI